MMKKAKINFETKIKKKQEKNQKSQVRPITVEIKLK